MATKPTITPNMKAAAAEGGIRAMDARIIEYFKGDTDEAAYYLGHKVSHKRGFAVVAGPKKGDSMGEERAVVVPDGKKHPVRCGSLLSSGAFRPDATQPKTGLARLLFGR